MTLQMQVDDEQAPMLEFLLFPPLHLTLIVGLTRWVLDRIDRLTSH